MLDRKQDPLRRYSDDKRSPRTITDEQRKMLEQVREHTEDVIDTIALT